MRLTWDSKKGFTLIARWLCECLEWKENRVGAKGLLRKSSRLDLNHSEAK